MVYPPLLVLFQLQFKVIITCNSFNKTEKHCYATETSWQLCELLKDLLDLTSWSEEAIYCSVHMWRTMSKTMSHAERSVYLSSCDFFFFLKNSIMRFWRKSKAKNGFFLSQSHHVELEYSSFNASVLLDASSYYSYSSVCCRIIFIWCITQ